MIRAAAKNFGVLGGRDAARDVRRRAAGARGRRRQALARHARVARGRGVLVHRALRHRDRALVRREAGRLPAADDVARTRRSPTSRTARTRTSGPPTTRRSARACTCSRWCARSRARTCRSTTSSTSTPGGCWSRSSTSRPARSSSTTTRAARRSAAPRGEAYERAFACDPQSAFGGDRVPEPPGRRPARRADRQPQFCEVLFAPHFTEDALERARGQAEHAHPRGQRAAPVQHRRARPQARDGRAARAGPRHRPRGPHRDGGRHRAQADRGRVGRDAVRLEGLQARPLERDRARARPRHRSASARVR